MNYLSPQIKALAKKSSSINASLVKKSASCGIFQEYEGVNDHRVTKRSS